MATTSGELTTSGAGAATGGRGRAGLAATAALTLTLLAGGAIGLGRPTAAPPVEEPTGPDRGWSLADGTRPGLLAADIDTAPTSGPTATDSATLRFLAGNAAPGGAAGAGIWTGSCRAGAVDCLPDEDVYETP